MCPTLSSQWSICTHPQAVAVLQVPHCATASETHGQRCTVRDMMHEVRAEPLDHRTRSAGLYTGEACQRISHPLQLQVCSTCYGNGTAAPSGSHLPREGYPLKRNLVVEAPCPSPSDAGVCGGGGQVGGCRQSSLDGGCGALGCAPRLSPRSGLSTFAQKGQGAGKLGPAPSAPLSPGGRWWGVWSDPTTHCT